MTVLGEKYLITQADQSLIVIDLVAAKYHIVYLRLRRAHSDGEVRSRPLLVPVNQIVTEAEATLVEEGGDRLAVVGLDIRRLGPETVSLRQIPIVLEQSESSRLVAAVIEYLSESDVDLESLIVRLATCAADSSLSTDPASLADLLRALESDDMEVPHSPVCYRLGLDEISTLLRENRG